ncbi:MAG: cysteine desulfurase NifS [Methanobacteriota archaeon]|nr:MAG: cysteine desulfurase NifS [Euryarchaeota archaeon]
MSARPIKRIYFDHGATTPMLPEVIEAMEPYFAERCGNASSIHSYGREAKRAVDDARARVAKLINADPKEIVFTSGGTESDNLAIKGTAQYKGRTEGHVITSGMEHHAVLEPCARLKTAGFDVTELPITRDGFVEPVAVEAAVREDTVLISVMMANSEVGTIQPVREIASIARARGIPFHTDAVQAVGKIPIDVRKDNIDMLSISSHKIYGPKGVGALYVKAGTSIEPILHGGGHERGLRSSTENVPGIVGLGKAAEIAGKDINECNERMRGMRDQMIESVLKTVPDAYLNGHPTKRLAGNAHFRFDFIEGEGLVLRLDLLGIATSTGSACSTGSLDPSHVLLAMGLKHEQAHGSLRITLGRENTHEEVRYFLDVLPGVVSKLREISPFGNDRPMKGGMGERCVQ